MTTPTFFHAFTDTPVRFFHTEDTTTTEISESDFAARAQSDTCHIHYKRHTVRENGVSQICLEIEDSF